MSTLIMASKGKQTEGAGEERQRRTAAVQIEKDLARMIAVIASHDGITQSDLVSAHLRPFILTHYERVQQAIQKEIEATKRGQGR